MERRFGVPAIERRGTCLEVRRQICWARFRAQAARVLKQLEGQIHKLESELAHLKAQGDSWRAALGGKFPSPLGARRGPGRPPGRSAGVRRSGGTRVKWDEVLAFLPAQFGVQDVMKHPGAASKGRAQVYPALNRWEATKRVKRIGKGLYEKASGSSSPADAATPAKRGPSKKRAAAKKPAAGKKRGRPVKAADAK